MATVNELLSRSMAPAQSETAPIAPPTGSIVAPAQAPVSAKAGKEKATKKTTVNDLLARSMAPSAAPAVEGEAPEKPIVFAPSVPNAKEFDLSDTLARGATTYASTVASGLGFTETGREWADYAAQNFPAHTPDVTKLESLGDAASFVMERFLENSPNLAATMAGGAAGTMVGGPVGGIIGGILASAPAIFGEVRQSIQRETGKDDPLAAAPAATFNTLLETITPMRLLKNLGVDDVAKKALVETVKENPGLKALIKKAAKEGGVSTITEGGTEGIQQYTQILTNKVLKDEKLLSLSDEQKNEIVNAIAGGAAGGGPAGGMSVVAGNIIARDTPEGEAALASDEQVLTARLQESLAAIEANEKLIQAAAAQRDIDNPAGDNLDLTNMVSGTAGSSKAVPGQDALNPLFGNYDLTADYFSDLTFDTQDKDGNQIQMPVGTAALPHGKVTAVGSSQTPAGFQQTLNETATHLSDLLSKMGLSNLKIMLMDTNTANSKLTDFAIGPTTRGAATRLKDGTYVIGLNPVAMETESKQYATKHQTPIQQLLSLDVSHHELGHIILDSVWGNASVDERKALAKGYKDTITTALKGSYKDKVNAMGMISDQLDVMGDTFSGQVKYKPWLKGQKQKVPGSPGFVHEVSGINRDKAIYQTNFPEYSANQFARYALNRVVQKKTDVPPGLQSLFSRAFEQLRKFYNVIRRKTKTHETFEAFLNNMFLKEEVRQIQDVLANQTPEAKKQMAVLRQELEAQGLQQAQTPINLNTTTYSAATSGSYKPIYSVSFIANLAQSLGLNGLASKLRHHEDLSMGYARISSLLTPIQVAELAKKAGFNNPDAYMQIIQEYANTKMKQIERADRIMNLWKKTKNPNRVSKLLYEISTSSDEKGRQLNIKEIDVIAQSLGATQEDLAMWREIDNSFRDILDNIERGLIYEAARSHNADIAKAKQFREDYLNAANDAERVALVEAFTGVPFVNPQTLALGHPLFTELEAIRTSIRKMSNKNYFPRSRMGEYVVKVTATAKGQKWEGHTAKKEGETLGYYAFDTKKERDAALKEMLPDATTAGVAIAGDKLETEIYSLMSMPQIMIDKIGRELNLTDEQQAKMRDISLNMAPGKRFLRHLQKRRGIAGYNEDAMRVYANYMMSASNHLARVEHSRDLIQALNDVDAFIADKKNWALGTVLDDVTRLRDYFRRHFQYVMKPDNDWAGLRALGFVWYLGFNVKSAMVNMTQVPFVTFPVLGAKYGDKKAATEIGKAYGTITKWIMGKQNLSLDEQALIDTLREQGIIDESMVSELAGFGEADVLKRMIPGLDLKGGFNRISYYAGTMFRMGEKYNRLVTALSTYKLATARGMTHDEAVKEARTTIQTTQYEYAKWNRPEFMRGKKSIIFMFWQYLQHSAFLFAGGHGKQAAMRMWVMTALTAGLLGLPFAETLLDLLDESGTFMKKLFGAADPRVDTREFIRDLLLEITDQPDKILYGMSSYWGLGPLHLAGLFGAPIPNVDVQGSVSYGRMIPWMEPLMADAANPDEKMGRVAAAIAGPIVGIPLQMYKAVASDDPNTWKAVERSLPTFMKNAVQGTRWLMEGQETFRGEGKLMDFTDPEGRVASALKALGFQPTPLTQKYRQIRAFQEASTYYGTRRQLLMADFYHAKKTGDREGMADVRSAINEFNKMARESPDLKKMAITGRDLNQSYRARRKAVQNREQGRADKKKDRAIQGEIERLYPIDE